MLLPEPGGEGSLGTDLSNQLQQKHTLCAQQRSAFVPDLPALTSDSMHNVTSTPHNTALALCLLAATLSSTQGPAVPTHQ